MAQINKPTDYFNTKLYTGTGASASITGVGFQPDWVWIKSRTSADWHILTDAVRGATTEIYTNATNGDNTNVNQLTSFDSDGFSLGGANDTGRSGENFVAWNWLADNTSGSSNTDGSITSTVSANTTSGFSIVSYTGSGTSSDTVGHGLGVAPKVVIVKDRSSGTNQWRVRHESLSSNYNLFLNGTDVAYNMATATNDGGIGDLDNANTFDFVSGISNTNAVNTSGNNYIAYCFAEKKGFSKFGSYTGNGSASDGTFVYTGFKPAFVMIKRYNASGHDWILIDNKRVGYNADNNTLLPNSSSAEDTGNRIDILSNGFKNYNANGSENENGGTYIYMAFAESPLVGTNNTPATAR